MSYQIDVHRTLRLRYRTAAAANEAANDYISGLQDLVQKTVTKTIIKNGRTETTHTTTEVADPVLKAICTAHPNGASTAQTIRDEPGEASEKIVPHQLRGLFRDGSNLTVRVLPASKSIVIPTPEKVLAKVEKVYLLMACEKEEAEVLAVHRTSQSAERALEKMMLNSHWRDEAEVRRGREGVYAVKLLMRDGEKYGEEVVARVVEMVVSDSG